LQFRKIEKLARLEFLERAQHGVAAEVERIGEPINVGIAVAGLPHAHGGRAEAMGARVPAVVDQ
jgi:hypothetical protein